MILVLFDEKPSPAGEYVQMKQFILPTEEEIDVSSLDDFVATHDVIDTLYAAVSGKNILHQEYVTGLALVIYKESGRM